MDIKTYKNDYLDSIANENNKKYNEKWPYLPDHPYRILIVGGFWSEKTNTLLNSIKEQDYHDVIDKITPKRDKKSLNCFWWHDCRYYDK